MDAVLVHLRNEQFNNFSDYSTINFSSDSSEYVSEQEGESESKIANASPMKIPREEDLDVPLEFMNQSALESGDECPPPEPVNRRVQSHQPMSMHSASPDSKF